MQRRAILRATLLLIPSALGCGAADDSTPAVRCEDAGAVTAAGDAFDACVTFAEVGMPPRRHILHLHFSAQIIVELSVPIDTAAGSELDFASMDAAPVDAARATAGVFDYRGFEDGPRALCATQPGFPTNAATSGTVRVDRLAADSGGYIAAIDGSLDATFEGCTIVALGLSGEPLVVHATF